MLVGGDSMTDKRRAASAVCITVFSCIVMAVIDGIVEPPYAVKSAVKLVMFVVLPLIYMISTGDDKMRRRFSLRENAAVYGAALGVGVCIYALIVGGFFLLRGVVDFSAVTESLAGGEGVTRDNFIYVAVYISFINSFCEELMFRGFSFGVLRDRMSGRAAYVFSSAAFAAYHVAIMSGWFSPIIFVLLIAGLAAGGAIFDFFDDRAGTIYPSWIIHIFANLGINTVGLVLFGII